MSSHKLTLNTFDKLDGSERVEASDMTPLDCVNDLDDQAKKHDAINNTDFPLTNIFISYSHSILSFVI
ncbi:hypothetical protein QR98_0025140 [Sarcoptes scabiei]|uniref:Uncharacterized protein n=1 Tax=Sarcoptes scabiei TaxID=52283 RepID=A0A132A0L0_SARSC|nr:hypothetical protein QR98_0025140 [Sarcoptes scabiei]